MLIEQLGMGEDVVVDWSGGQKLKTATVVAQSRPVTAKIIFILDQMPK
jgi:hypothetical protein